MLSRKFGSRSTGDDVLAGIDLSGQLAVITGATSGLGLETARVLASAGADVVITARTAEKGEAAAQQVRSTGAKGSVSVQQLDLSDLASVRVAAAALGELGDINMLILNAGVMGTPQSYTKQGFEMQIGTNHFGHFMLVHGLLPKLTAQRAPMDFEDLHFRERKYSGMRSYAQSKTANVLFTSELARRLEGTGASAFSVHPGSIGTDLMRHWLPYGSWRRWLVSWALRWLPLLIGEVKTVPQGVATSVYAATAPELEGHSGAYLENCRIKKPSTTGRDPQQAARLWAVTEEQIAAADSPGGFKP